jgi:hypothetical protein
MDAEITKLKCMIKDVANKEEMDRTIIKESTGNVARVVQVDTIDKLVSGRSGSSVQKSKSKERWSFKK